MITIVTDSSSYLTQAEAAALGVVMVPMSYSIGRAVYPEAFVDRERRFEHILDGAPATLHTSQATLSAFVSAFDGLKKRGSEVLCLTISSRLSGTYGNALVAARDLGGEGIAVIDSRSTAAGLYLLIRAAKRLIDEGLPLAEVAARVSGMRERVKLVFSVDDIGPLRRSGRLGGIKLSVSTILNIHPMLRCQEGAIIATGVTRGRHEQQRQLICSIPSEVKDVVVQHYRAEGQLTAVIRQLQQAGRTVSVRDIGPVLAVHLGKGCIGVAWMEG